MSHLSHLSSRDRGLRRRQHGQCSILEVYVWGHSEPSDHKPEPDLRRRNAHLNVSCTTGVGPEVARMWGEQTLDTKDSDWMLLLQLASTHLSWTWGHSCPSPCRHGLGLPGRMRDLANIPYHPTNCHLYSYLTWKTSSCLTLNDWDGVRDPALSLAFKSGIGI